MNSPPTTLWHDKLTSRGGELIGFPPSSSVRSPVIEASSHGTCRQKETLRQRKTLWRLALTPERDFVVKQLVQETARDTTPL